MSSLTVTTIDCDSHPWELLTNGSAPSAVANFDVDISSYAATHDRLLFEMEEVVAATDGVTFQALVSYDAGSTFLTTSTYDNARYTISASGGGSAQNSAADAKFAFLSDLGNAAGEFASGHICLLNPYDASNRKLFTSEFFFASSTTGGEYVTGGGWEENTSDAIDQIRFSMDSGNLTVATWRLFGRKVL